MTNQQGAPEALRLADALCKRVAESSTLSRFDGDLAYAAAELRHLHAETERLAALVEAQQPATSAAVALSDDLRDRLVAISEAIADQDDRAAQAMLREILAAPQPSPTPQADSQPVPQGETNVQLDTDSNHSAPGQQWDVAGPVALGQPMGDGPDQAAGHLSAQGDKLLTVAERNIRSFLRSAVFKSESDREAALNCVDVLWAAARAPADSVTAPAALCWLRTASAVRPELAFMPCLPGDPNGYPVYLAQPAQAADSVQDLQPVHDAVTIDLLNERVAYLERKLMLEDAAFEAVRKKLCALPRFSFVLDDDGLIRRVQDRTGNWIEFDAAHELFDPIAVDAARKQGGAT